MTLFRLVFIVCVAGATLANGQVKLIDNGPDGEKLVFAVLGDGYTEGEQAKFQGDVDRLVVNGVFANDFYRDNRRAFNVYRIDLKSKESGVSTPSVQRDTSLKTVFTGTWETAWIQESADTDSLINSATAALPKFDFVLIILNETGWGGVRRGSRMYVTSGIPWTVVAHEYGHGIGNLFDEYTGTDVNVPGDYFGPTVNARNVSTVVDRTRVIWKDLIKDSTNVPTVIGPGIDAVTTVGMFEGALYKDHRIYRPVHNCRMRSNGSLFCPVCLRLMQAAVAPYLGVEPTESSESSGAGPAGSGSDATHMHVDAHKQSAPGPAPGNPPGRDPGPKPSYLTMVLRVTDGGGAEVISAKEVPGKLILPASPTSNFIYEVTSGERTVAAAPLPEDPFLIRGIPDPAGKKGERLDRAKTATIVVRVPKDDAQPVAAEALGLRIYRVDADISDQKVNLGLLEELKKSDLLKVKVESRGSELGPQLMKRLEEGRSGPKR